MTIPYVPRERLFAKFLIRIRLAERTASDGYVIVQQKIVELFEMPSPMLYADAVSAFHLEMDKKYRPWNWRFVKYLGG